MSLLFDDASSQYLDRAGVPISAPPFTMLCWFQTDDNASAQTLLALNDTASEDNYHSLVINGQNFRARTFGDSLVETGSGFGLADNQWYFGVGRWAADDSRQASVFDVSGTLLNSRTETTSKAVTGLNRTVVGRLSTLTPGDYHSGLIAERAIVAGVLSDADVAALALQLSPLKISSAASVLEYTPLYGSTNPALEWIQGNNLTFNNTPLAAAHLPAVLQNNKPIVTPAFGKDTISVEMSGDPCLEVAFAGFPIEIAMEACASMLIDTELFVPVANPPLAGDLVDVGNNSVFQLNVGGTLLDFTVDQFDVDDLTISYDGRQLGFSEITCIDSQTFFNEDAVTLDLDFTGTGSTLERVFTGRVRQVEIQGINNDEAVRYVAFGNQQIANDITLVNTDDRPSVTFTVGSSVTTTTSAGTPTTVEFTKQIKDAISELFVIHNTRLGSIGIPSTIGFPGLEQFTAQLPETVELTNVGFTTAIAQLSAFQPGVKVFWDDLTQKWIFPNIKTVPTAKVDINSMNVMGLPYTLDTDDRFTAIRLFANVDDALDEAIITKSASVSIGGRQGSIQRTEITLEPYWLPELQVDWTIMKALQPNPFTLETEFFWVYKRWKMPNDIVPQWPGTPVRAFQKVNNWGVVGWQKLHGRAIFGRRIFISRFHAIHRGNPIVPGDVIGPLEVRLAYYPLQFNYSFTSTINSMGTPTIVNTDIDQADFLDTIRIPTAGYEGTANSKFGIERELVQVVDRTEVTTINAQAILDTHKDVIISGDIEVDGDPLPELIHLGRKVVVQHDTRLTGIESLPGLCTQYTYRFGKRGRSTISLTTDIAGMIRTQ